MYPPSGYAPESMRPMIDIGSIYGDAGNNLMVSTCTVLCHRKILILNPILANSLRADAMLTERPKSLTFRLPSFFCDTNYQGGGSHDPPLQKSVLLLVLLYINYRIQAYVAETGTALYKCVCFTQLVS